VALKQRHLYEFFYFIYREGLNLTVLIRTEMKTTVVTAPDHTEQPLRLLSLGTQLYMYTRKHKEELELTIQQMAEAYAGCRPFIFLGT